MESKVVQYEDKGSGLLTSFLPPGAGGQIIHWSDLSPDRPEDRELWLACWEEAKFTSDDVMNCEFSIRHVFMHPVEVRNRDTGELSDAIRTVLIDPQDQTYAFVSVGICKSIKLMGAAYGPPPWVPALRVRLEMARRKSGYKPFVLRVLGQGEK